MARSIESTGCEREIFHSIASKLACLSQAAARESLPTVGETSDGRRTGRSGGEEAKVEGTKVCLFAWLGSPACVAESAGVRSFTVPLLCSFHTVHNEEASGLASFQRSLIQNRRLYFYLDEKFKFRKATVLLLFDN